MGKARLPKFLQEMGRLARSAKRSAEETTRLGAFESQLIRAGLMGQPDLTTEAGVHRWLRIDQDLRDECWRQWFGRHRQVVTWIGNHVTVEDSRSFVNDIATTELRSFTDRISVLGKTVVNAHATKIRTVIALILEVNVGECADEGDLLWVVGTILYLDEDVDPTEEDGYGHRAARQILDMGSPSTDAVVMIVLCMAYSHVGYQAWEMLQQRITQPTDRAVTVADMQHIEMRVLPPTNSKEIRFNEQVTEQLARMARVSLN